jgi:hypothetical protein
LLKPVSLHSTSYCLTSHSKLYYLHYYYFLVFHSVQDISSGRVKATVAVPALATNLSNLPLNRDTTMHKSFAPGIADLELLISPLLYLRFVRAVGNVCGIKDQQRALGSAYSRDGFISGDRSLLSLGLLYLFENVTDRQAGALGGAGRQRVFRAMRRRPEMGRKKKKESFQLTWQVLVFSYVSLTVSRRGT